MNFILRRSASLLSTNVRPVPIIIGQIGYRQFSALSEVLANELLTEKSQELFDQEFIDIKKEISKSFSIKDTPGYSKVVLERKFKADLVTVTFDCQDEAEDDTIPEFNQEEEPLEEDEEPEEPYLINFDVLLTKGGAGDKVHFSCVAGDKLTVRNIAIIPNGKEIGDTELYSGPVYQYLDEELKTSFLEYLAERKIDDNLSDFILMYSKQKEQKEYEGWLSSVLDFVEKP